MKTNRVILFLLITVLVAASLACQRSVPGAVERATSTPGGEPVAGPTDILNEVYQFATQTEIANQALGTPAAPQETPAPAGQTQQPPAIPEQPTQGVILPIGPTQGAILPAPTQGPAPASYTLQKNEFPFCIARRFNVDPAELLRMNGLSSYSVYYAGMVLRIPQSGRGFPGNRALQPHPTAYTVSGSETIFSIACTFGDVDPMAIAAVNGLQPPYKLQPGMTLQIP